MKQPDKQKRIYKQGVIFMNCFKLTLCNKELNYIFKRADTDEIKIYNSSQFLISFVEKTNIQFCVLSSILLTDNEEFSIPNFINSFIPDGETKKSVWNTINDYEFQSAFRRIRKLRDKCYVHLDKEESKVRETIKLTQDERNLITNGIVSSIQLIYSEFKDGHLEFFDHHPSDIQSQIRMVSEWRNFNVKAVAEKITMSKKIVK